MSLYTIDQDGKIVDARTGRVVSLDEEERRLDYQPQNKPSDSINRMIDMVIRESRYQSRTA